MSEDTTTVTRNDAAGQYEIHVDGQLAGFTKFRPRDGGKLVFPHTEIDPAFAGRGLGSILVGDALADVAQREEILVPRCPFVIKYLEGHVVPNLVIEWPEDEKEALPPAVPAAPL